MKKLRLAVFNTQPPLFLGGVERRILEMAKHLQNQVDTTVYSGTKAGLSKTVTLNGLTVVPCFSTDKVFPLDNWTFNQTLLETSMPSELTYTKYILPALMLSYTLLKNEVSIKLQCKLFMGF